MLLLISLVSRVVYSLYVFRNMCLRNLYWPFQERIRASLVAQWLGVAWQCKGQVMDFCSRKILHTAGQLSHCTTAPQILEPALTSCNYWAHVLQLLKSEWLESMLCKQEKPAQGEAHVAQSESSPHSLQLEKAVAWQQRPSTIKNK